MNLILYQEHNLVVISISGAMLGEVLMRDVIAKVDALLALAQVNVVMDLKNIQLINSSGVGMLITCLLKVRRKQGDIVLANVPEPIRKILELVELTQVFTLVNSVEDAKGVFKTMGKKTIDKES